jgi:hypothetical protein
MMFDTTPASASVRGKSAHHRREGDEDLVVVGAAVVAVLILLPDLADHRVGQAVQVDGLAQAVAGAEQLRRGVGADDGDPQRALFVGEAEHAAALDVDGTDGLVLRLDAVVLSAAEL